MKDVNGNVMNYCGSLNYEFLNLDSTSFASTSEISYNLAAKSFSMATNQPNKVGSYPLKLKVSLANYTSVQAATKNFKV